MTTRLAVLFAVGCALLGGVRSRTAGAEPCCIRSAGAGPTSAAKCGLCHADFYREWKSGAHSHAWTDEVYRDALKRRSKPELCHSCHVPADVHARLGHNPGPRKDLLDEGVTCVSCHEANGKIQGPFDAPTEAHPTEKNPAFGESASVDLCASCHSTKIGPVLPVARDHEAYRKRAGKDAKTCVGCHMPQVERHLAVSSVTGEPVGEKRETRRHDVLGPRDAAFAASALALGAAADGKDLVVSVANRAGHRVPGLTLRSFVATVAQLGADEQTLAEDRVEISHEDPIPPAETRQLRFELVAGAVAVRLRVDHVFGGDEVGTILEETFRLAAK